MQVLTLEGWSDLTYNYSDASDPVISVIFFIGIVLLGAFFAMNLVLIFNNLFQSTKFHQLLYSTSWQRTNHSYNALWPNMTSVVPSTRFETQVQSQHRDHLETILGSTELS